MKAALLHQFGQPLTVEDVPEPVPESDEVLIRVEACGVCHSDLHMTLGDWPDVAAKMTLPAILGHEVVGVVVEKGREVRGLGLNDRVGVGWLYSVCGDCEPCSDGAENLCVKRKVTGIAAPGGFAEFMRIRASQAIRVPSGLAPEQAAPFFCAGLTVYHACKRAGVRDGQRVAVFGVGGLGHLAVQLARHAGAEVVAVDIGEAKLELAHRVGATEAYDARNADTVTQLKAGGGPHVALVTTASKPAYDLAFRTLRRRGTLAVIGLPKEDLTFFADHLAVGEFRIIGSAVGTRRETRGVLALADGGMVHCEVETHPLAEINEVFARMLRRQIPGRAVIKMQ